MMVHLVRQIRIQVAKGIVGERGKVNNRVEAQEGGGLDIPEILLDGRYILLQLSERAFLIKIGIQTDHLKSFFD
jgi:hypothetical protein